MFYLAKINLKILQLSNNLLGFLLLEVNFALILHYFT